MIHQPGMEKTDRNRRYSKTGHQGITVGMLFILLVLPAGFGALQAQQLKVSAGTQVPVQYAVGIQYRPFPSFSAQAGLGVITRPYDGMILQFLEWFNTDQEYLRMIEGAFEAGGSADLRLQGHLGNWYLGAYAQYITLRAADRPLDLIENYYNIDLDGFPEFRRLNITSNEVQLKSELFQLGVAAGREFHFASPRWGMFLEVSVSKNIASRNRGYANGKEMRTLTVLIDDELDPVYRAYAYIPSVNVGVTYRFVPGNQGK